MHCMDGENIDSEILQIQKVDLPSEAYRKSKPGSTESPSFRCPTLARATRGPAFEV
jgi:hypothetical protein